jgi:hypothetical protein
MVSVGVTGRLTGYVCALAQFLNADDFRQMSQVCRQDLHACDALFALSESLLYPKVGPGAVRGTILGKTLPVPWMSVLRGETSHPVCYARAETASLRAITRYLLDDKIFTCGVDGDRCFSGISIDYVDAMVSPFFTLAPIKFGPIFDEGRWKWSRMNHTLEESNALNGLYNTSGYATSYVCTVKYCARVLLYILIEMGDVLNYVYISDGQRVDAVVALWFALGVGPYIPIECEKGVVYQSDDPRIMSHRAMPYGQ